MKLSEAIVPIAKKEVGVEEQPRGSNRGPRVDEYLAATWMSKKDQANGFPWCAAFVCWVVREAMALAGVEETKTFKRPKTAGAWDFEHWSLSQDNTTQTKHKPGANDVQPGDIVIYTFSHIGIAISTANSDGMVICIEGNSNENGSREGYKVVRKARHLRTIKSRIRFTV
jgi:hypothetical protein